MRTEQEILKDFKKIGYEISFDHKDLLYLKKKECDDYYFIDKKLQKYSLSEFAEITMKGHKLLHELFKCWGWLDEN